MLCEKALSLAREKFGDDSLKRKATKDGKKKMRLKRKATKDGKKKMRKRKKGSAGQEVNPTKTKKLSTETINRSDLRDIAENVVEVGALYKLRDERLKRIKDFETFRENRGDSTEETKTNASRHRYRKYIRSLSYMTDGMRDQLDDDDDDVVGDASGTIQANEKAGVVKCSASDVAPKGAVVLRVQIYNNCEDYAFCKTPGQEFDVLSCNLLTELLDHPSLHCLQNVVGDAEAPRHVFVEGVFYSEKAEECQPALSWLRKIVAKRHGETAVRQTIRTDSIRGIRFEDLK
eukprot:g1551.t1